MQIVIVLFVIFTVVFFSVQIVQLKEKSSAKENNLLISGLLHKILYEYNEMLVVFSEGIWKKIGVPSIHSLEDYESVIYEAEHYL